MSENSRDSAPRNYAPVWGIFLLFLGIILLLQTLNILPWSLWGTLWKFWPAIIIIIGMSILLRHYTIWLISILVVFILGASLGIAIWQNDRDQGKISGTEIFIQPLSNLNQAQVKIDFAAGDLKIDSLSANSLNLAEVRADIRDDVSSLQTIFNSQDRNGYLNLKSTNQQYWPGGGISWRAEFTPDVPLSFDITSAASTTTLNFSDIDLSAVKLDLNAGTCDLNFPAPKGTVTANIIANAATVEISLPSQAAARIEAKTSLASLNINNRFIRDGDDYVTENYSDSTDRLEIKIDTNVGRVTIN